MAFTYFFRDLHTLEHVVRHVTRDMAGSRRVRVWDAGCANGPEPYSLAIVFAMCMGTFAFKNLHIDATDLDVSNLFGDIIATGIYSHEQLGRIPPDIVGRFFHPVANDGQMEINENIRRRLQFHRHDLLSLNPVGEGYHLVLCKNVLLHFQPDERIDVIRMFHRSLVDRGYFAMEQTQKLPWELSHLFEQVSPDAQVYRKIAGGG